MQSKKRKIVLILIAAVGFFLMVGVGAYIASRLSPSQDTKLDDTNQTPPVTLDAVKKAENAASNGDYDGAITILKDEKSEIADPEAEKSRVAELEAEIAAYEHLKENVPPAPPAVPERFGAKAN